MELTSKVVQTQSTVITETDSHRLIVSSQAGTAVLLTPEGDDYRLPVVEIQRIYEHSHVQFDQ